MIETSSGQVAVPPAKSAQEQSFYQLAMVCYGLLLAAFVIGVTAVVAVIIAYIQRGDARGTVWESHYRNVIVIFWVMLATLLVSIMTFPLALGLLFAGDFSWTWLSALSLPVVFWTVVLPILLIWFLYRIIKGLIRASESRAY